MPGVVQSQLFEVHGSKLKRDPLCNAGQASMVGITHGVFFLRIGKDTMQLFNALFRICPKISAASSSGNRQQNA